MRRPDHHILVNRSNDSDGDAVASSEQRSPTTPRSLGGRHDMSVQAIVTGVRVLNGSIDREWVYCIG